MMKIQIYARIVEPMENQDNDEDKKTLIHALSMSTTITTITHTK